MNKDKITIVSGEPRSGTSLMMQTLIALGMDIAGDKKPNEDRFKHFKDENGEWKPEYIEKREDIERRIKHSDMMNPLGFYETEFVSRGVRGYEAEKFKGKVMKIITSGIPEHHGRHGMVGTSRKLIDKIILCVRNPKNIAVSQKNLINDNILVSNGEDWVYHNDSPPSPLAYLNRTGGFIVWLDDNMDITKDILIVEFEDMLSNPNKEIERIVDFLGIKPSVEQFNEAVGNVTPRLKRSETFEKWPEQFEKDGELAMQMYEAISTLDKEKITYVSTLLQSRRLDTQLEGSQWVDDNDGCGAWIITNASLYRDILCNKNNLQEKLVSNASSKDCTKCSHHCGSDEKYTIQRPVDLGDLVRNMVWCDRDKDLKTIEQCYRCYTFGSILDGEQMPPENRNRVLVNN